MTDDFITIDPSSILNLQKLERKFGALAPRLLDVGTEAAGKYLLGILRKTVPPLKYVSRTEAYGVPWFSERQRGWMFANLFDEGGNYHNPYPRRSPGGGVAAGWMMYGSGAELQLVNEADDAGIVYGIQQPRQLAMVGWPQVYRLVDDYSGKATDSAARAISKEVNTFMMQEG